MAQRKRSDEEHEQLAQRLQDLELVLALTGERGVQRLRREWKMSAREFNALLERAKQQMLDQAAASASWRNAAMLRKVQIAQQRAFDAQQYGLVAALVAREQQLSTGLASAEICEKVAKALGPPPKDSAETLTYARKALQLNLQTILADPTLSTKERTYLLNDTTAKLGLTHDRDKLELLAKDVEKAKPQKKNAAALAKGQFKKGWKPGESQPEAAPAPDPGAGSRPVH